MSMPSCFPDLRTPNLEVTTGLSIGHESRILIFGALVEGTNRPDRPLFFFEDVFGFLYLLGDFEELSDLRATTAEPPLRSLPVGIKILCPGTMLELASPFLFLSAETVMPSFLAMPESVSPFLTM
jgi:hypothetical protein